MRVLNFGILAGAVAVVSLGCAGSSGSTGPSTTTTTTPVHAISATVNGAAWSATVVSGGYGSGSFTLAGTGAGSTINIAGISMNGPGTYSLANSNPQSAQSLWVDNTGTYQSLATGGSGQLVLTTAVLGHIKGSFDFTGTFLVSLQQTRTVRVIGTFEVTSP